MDSIAVDAPDTCRFDDDRSIPNSELPVLIYHGIDEVPSDAAACEALFDRNDWWPFWRDGIYSFHHFHSTAHEALGVVAGRAAVVVGGPVNGLSSRRATWRFSRRERGTAMSDRAGTSSSSAPTRWGRELRRGDPAEPAEAVSNIKRVPLPEADPVRGADGPLMELWR